MQNANGSGGPGLDLAGLLGSLFQGNGQGIGLAGLKDVMLAHQENSLIMRRHMLRAEREILEGLMALVNGELEKVESELAQGTDDKPVGREKVSIS